MRRIKVEKVEKDELLKQLQELSKNQCELSKKIESFDNDDIENTFEMQEEKKVSQMLDISPDRVDSFGDSVELVTKSRLKDYTESAEVAKKFVLREYHNMEGNRYGKHSKLIPVESMKKSIDMSWFSGCQMKIIERNGIQYYKVRMLVYDIYIKKLLLSRIPTKDGIARQEEIQHIGAEKAGQRWTQENAPLNPMKPISYQNMKKTTMKNVGEMVFEQ